MVMLPKKSFQTGSLERTFSGFLVLFLSHTAVHVFLVVTLLISQVLRNLTNARQLKPNNLWLSVRSVNIDIFRKTLSNCFFESVTVAHFTGFSVGHICTYSSRGTLTFLLIIIPPTW